MAKQTDKNAAGSDRNPYRANQSEYAGQYGNPAEYGQTNSAYAAPAHMADAPYTDAFGWGPGLRSGVSGTPDAMRTNETPVRYFAPRGGDAPEVFYGSRGNEENRRHVQNEEQDADGWTERKDSYKVGRNPRDTPVPESRPTQQMSPRTYSFMRPFDQINRVWSDMTVGSARHLNGQHFSMADHRREYDVLGMAPWNRPRNTYRIDPAPWDQDMVDMPTEYAPVSNRVQAVEIQENLNPRSWRLG